MWVLVAVLCVSSCCCIFLVAFCCFPGMCRSSSRVGVRGRRGIRRKSKLQAASESADGDIAGSPAGGNGRIRRGNSDNGTLIDAAAAPASAQAAAPASEAERALMALQEGKAALEQATAALREKGRRPSNERLDLAGHLAGQSLQGTLQRHRTIQFEDDYASYEEQMAMGLLGVGPESRRRDGSSRRRSKKDKKRGGSSSGGSSKEEAQQTVLYRLYEAGVEITEEVQAVALQTLSENHYHVGRTINRVKQQFKGIAHNVTVRRGEDGLGIDVGIEGPELNLIKEVIEGSRAAEEDEIRVGDVIIAVDGEEMKGRMLAEVLTPGLPFYAFTVLRRKVTSSKTTLVEEQQAAACKVQAIKRGRSLRRANTNVLQRLQEEGYAGPMTEEAKAMSAVRSTN